MLQLAEIIQELESFAPKSLQEPYDNSGLLVGLPNQVIYKALLCLDCLEEVVEEAIQVGANLVICHHPIIFKGLKSITGQNYIERVIIKAIKHDIAIYAAHTNLDNVLHGVNSKLAEKLGLTNLSILSTGGFNLKQLYVYVPTTHVEKVRTALFSAGAGQLGNYSECSFNINGYGTYKPNAKANPFQGRQDELHKAEEVKLEVVLPHYLENQLIKSLKASHPYEEIAYGLLDLTTNNNSIGAGMIGELSTEMDKMTFLNHIKNSLQTKCVRYTKSGPEKIRKVAICGGAGSFLISEAIKSDADAFVTGDFKYHEFFDHENKLMIADVGHYESEQFTMEIFIDILSKKFPNFALQITSVNTNPVQYY